MKVIPSYKNTVYFDVDDTIVFWDFGKDKTSDEYITVTFHSKLFSLRPNKKTIQYLKNMKAYGNTVVVWSQGGWEWAATIVETLNLQDHVDVVLSKPDEYVDDLNCSEFMTNRNYFGDDTNNG